MSSRRSFRHISHSQRRRRDAPAGDQCRGKAQVKEEEKPTEQEQGSAPRGTCQTMCPSHELQLRETQNRLHRFEMLAGTETDRRPKADVLRTVKEYSRPAAGKNSASPTDLRPPTVLMKTVCYLVDDIAASPNLHPWTEVYSFVFDRLRAVKQDMIIQRVSGKACIAVLEWTVRFLTYASFRLCGEPLHLYDPCINDAHLQESLSWLLDCYATGTGPHSNEEELQALGLLYNLGSLRATQHVMELPERLRSRPAITLALSINRAFLERNLVRLLRLSRKLDFLQSCALHRHLMEIHRDLLLIYSHGYSSRNCRFPLSRLAQLLDLNLMLTAQLCRSYGVEVNQDNQVLFSKMSFTEPERGKVLCALCHGIVAEKQRDISLKALIHGNITDTEVVK
ncbi:SAC3 domain-containing protein 1 [Thalassophryne amazonica]|uniref:SAC3 domain-containing protein 1 n=1 Tax=Thalassophryne amazonica TaxID=390379 RepID=UPI001470B0A8|nr:SAC3 domain-containing protein 1 [Thalassophryne amazonica]